MALMNVARSLALVVFLVVLHQRGSVDATTATLGTDSVTIVEANRFTGVQTSIKFTFTVSGQAFAVGDSIALKLPGFTFTGTTAPTKEGCGTSTFTNTVAATGTADAAVTFVVATATLAVATPCTITTAAALTNTGFTAHTASQNNWAYTGTMASGHDLTGAAVTTSDAIVVPTLSSLALSFDAYKFDTALAVSTTFSCTAALAQTDTIKVVLPSWTLTAPGTEPTTSGCGTTTFAMTVTQSTQADALVTFTAGTADMAANTVCTIITNSATTKTPAAPQTGNAANAAQKTIQRLGDTAVAITTSPSVMSPFYEATLHISYPVVSTASTTTFAFKSSVDMTAGKKITLKLPTFAVAVATSVTSTGCGTTTFAAVATTDITGTGTDNAAITFTTATATLTKDIACTITLPTGVVPGSAAQAQNLATRTVQSDITSMVAQPILHSTPTVASAALSNLALVVATTTGSTATSLSLTFDSNIPLAIGDYVMMTLPDWGVSGTTAPTAVGCGTSTFTTVTGLSGTATAYVQFSVATALLDTVTYLSHDYSMGHNCTLTWATGATTPAAAQAANLNTRKLSAVIAAGTDITNTSITTSTATTAAASGNNSTGTGGTATGTYSTATTTITFTGYTYAAGTAATNFGNVVGCAYAKTVSDATTSLTSNMCTASAGPTFTYLTGSSTINTVSAARRTGSSVAVALKMYHSLLSQTAATAAVTAVGTTLTAINANIAAVNTAAGTGFSTAELTATGMTAATWTHSSASVVVPSMMAMFSALLLVLMQ
jgi:hypothetical protein